MSDSLLLLANFGAEEGREDPDLRAEPGLRTVARLWKALFSADARLDRDPDAGADAWPAALGPRPAAAVFPWLEAPGRATAWLPTAAAAARAARDGRVLTGPPPELVQRVHDKAFAHAVARREGLGENELLEAIAVLSPETLADPASAAAQIDARLAGWPAWLRRSHGAPFATLKPRLGSSGRGRVALTSGSDAALRGALPRLAARGGALLEPWLARRADLSAALCIDASGGILLLGTLEPRNTLAGTCRGHRGHVDRKGRITSGSDFDEPLREAAVRVAAAAAAAGFRGPCGVDAFVYDGPDGSARLRPVVELNARFTLGHVTIGLVRRALPLLKQRLTLRAGARHAFGVDLYAPMPGTDEPGRCRWVLGPSHGEGAPALTVSEVAAHS